MQEIIDKAPQAYLHAIDPFAIEFTQGVGIRWYGLAYLCAFVSGYYLIQWMIRTKKSNLRSELVSDFVFNVAVGTIVGGRLGYCIFYSPELFTTFSTALPFWGVLEIHKGGMASHGGIAGIVLACVFFARKYKLSSLHLMDITILGGCIGVFFGRIANFINAELVGRPVTWAAPWAVKYPQDMLMWVASLSAESVQRLKQLQVAVASLGVGSDEWSALVTGSVSSIKAHREVEIIVSRLVDAAQQGNSIVRTEIAPLLLARHPSQLYEAFLEGALVFAILFFLWRKPRIPGFITGCFFIAYSIVRIIGEFFRMPDAQLGYQALGLTRGQWLSAVLFLIGIAFLAMVRRNKQAITAVSDNVGHG